MPITVPCVKCKTKFQVPSKFAGQKVRCKSCGCVLQLPSPEKIQAKKQGAVAAHGARSGSPPKPQQPSSTEELDIVDMYDGRAARSGLRDTPASQPQGNGAAPAAEPPVLSCSHCEGLLYYDPNFANQTVACPHCGNHLTMPEL
jgi:hypothetical protein